MLCEHPIRNSPPNRAVRNVHPVAPVSIAFDQFGGIGGAISLNVATAPRGGRKPNPRAGEISQDFGTTPYAMRRQISGREIWTGPPK